MSKTAEQAVAYARAEATRTSRDWAGWCLMFVRLALGIRVLRPDAITAWSHAQKRHSAGVPPRGVPVFWAIGEHGHVALSDGGGYCWSTDIRRRGKVDRVQVAEIARRWSSAKYLGWTEDLNGVRVNFTAPAAPKVMSLSAMVYAATHADAKPGTEGQIAQIRRSLAELGCNDPAGFRQSFRRWQFMIGDAGANADGIPGPRQATALARRCGYRLVA